MAYVRSITVPSVPAVKTIIVADDHVSLNRATKDTRAFQLVGDRGYDGELSVQNALSETLYSSGQAANNTQYAVAVTTSAGGTYLTINVSNIPEQFIGQNLSLQIISSAGPAMANSIVAVTSPVLVNSGNAAFPLASPTSGIPTGLWGLFNFALTPGNGGTPTALTGSPIALEVYAISVPELPPKIFDSGLPLTLLRMFILPVLIQNLTTEAEYVASVVKIVHGSAKPFTGESSSTRDHWLKYESMDREYSFTGYQGLYINIGAWLDAWRLYNQANIITAVNCYDQAAAAEVALGLGIPHDRVHWEYHQTFGFIPATTELVGWGPCNNPYFGHDVSQMCVDPQAPTRWAFRNHGYLSWSQVPITKALRTQYNNDVATKMAEFQKSNPDNDDARLLNLAYLDAAIQFDTDNNLGMKMIDACAGPHIGNEDRATYEASKTLVSLPYSQAGKQHYTTVSTSFAKNPTGWTEVHTLGPGLTDLTADGGFLLDQQFTNVYEEAFVQATTILGAYFWNDTVIQFVDMQSKETSILNWAIKIESSLGSLEQAPIRPYTTDTGGLIMEAKLSSTAGSTVQGGTVVAPASFFSVKVLLYPSAAALREQLCKYLAMRVLTSNAPVVNAAPLWNLNLNVPIISVGNCAASCYHNMAFVVTASPQFQSCMRAVVEKLILELFTGDSTLTPAGANWQEPFTNNSVS